MTTTSPQNTQPVQLKVVNPATRTPAKPPTNLTPTDAKPPIPTSAPKNKYFPLLNRLLILTLITGGCIGIGSLEIQNYVSGTSKIDSRENAREKVTMRVAGTIKLHVKSNETVKKGDILAEIENRDLINKLEEISQKLTQAQGELANNKQRLMIAQTKLESAKSEEIIAQNRVDKMRREIAITLQGEGLPSHRKIEAEQEGIKSEVAGVEQEILGLDNHSHAIQEQIRIIETQKETAKSKLESIEESIHRYQTLIEQGAFAEENPEFQNKILQKKDLEGQIKQLEIEIRIKNQELLQLERQKQQRRQSIAQKQSHIEAKSEQINELSKQMSDQLLELENALEIRGIQKQEIQREVESILVAIDNQQRQISELEKQQQAWQEETKNLTLVADGAGTILTPDLDLKNGTTLSLGTEVLQIANLSKLKAEVLIRQEDKAFVTIGQSVVYQDRDARKYHGTVEKMAPFINPEHPQGKPVIAVTILIDNPDHTLLPGHEGHAHIDTGKLSIYRKVQHELNKVFDWGKYFP